MRALTFHGKEELHYETVADPGIVQPTDVIVKVDIAAICGSDLHVYRAHEQGLDAGTVMGHEFVGEVVEVGREVKRFQKGDKVLSPFTTNCGHCYYCRIGLTCRCENGQLYGWVEQGEGLHGGQAEYVRVPIADGTLRKLNDLVTPQEGLLMGDILSTGYFCAENCKIHPEGVYVIVGCGPVGMMTIVGAIEQGAQQLYAIDAVPERLQMAEKFGATPLNYKTQNVVEIIKEATEGRGADAVMEVVGNTPAQRLAMDVIRPGGIISTVGVHTSPHFAFSPVEAYNKNLQFMIGRCPVGHYLPIVEPLVMAKKYPITDIITHEFALNEGVEAYDIFDKKKDNCMKIVLQMP
ncbi:hypothetical protein BKI52_23545 [marine bacterium AO1-C]|nr:hypothetical protein BKI52_23545 [marine bacterium AO1-C]